MRTNEWIYQWQEANEFGISYPGNVVWVLDKYGQAIKMPTSPIEPIFMKNASMSSTFVSSAEDTAASNPIKSIMKMTDYKDSNTAPQASCSKTKSATSNHWQADLIK